MFKCKVSIILLMIISYGFSQVIVDPVNDTVAPGQSASFSITGTGPYQWYKNDTLIVGATNTSYSFTCTRYNYDDMFYCIANGDTSTRAWVVVQNPNIVHVRNIAYKSTLDTAMANIYYDVCYDSTLYNKPPCALGHGFNGNIASCNDSWRERMVNKYNLFVIVIGMRGRSGGGGSQDCGAREIYDIVDGFNDAIGRYPTRIDTTKKIFYGVSGGGGNALSLAVKFPEYFDFIVEMFGMTDYADWYNETSLFKSTISSWVSDIPSGSPHLYLARCQLNAVKNAYLPRIWIVHDSADTIVQVHHSRDFYTASIDSGLTNIKYVETNPSNIRRAYHGYPALNDQPDLISFEPAIFNKINDTTMSEKTMLASGNIHVLGYLKTKSQFTIMGTGRTSTARLKYSDGNYTYYNGSTNNTVLCTLSISSTSQKQVVKRDYNGGSVTTNYGGSTRVPFSVRLTDSAVIYINDINTKYVDTAAYFGLLPSVDTTRQTYQGRRSHSTITASYNSFGATYGWQPPVIKWEQNGADSILTNFNTNLTSDSIVAFSFWWKFTGNDAATRGLFAFDESATSYWWLYIPANTMQLTHRIRIDAGTENIRTVNLPADADSVYHLFIAKNKTRVTVIVNGTNILIDTTLWNFAGNLGANLIIGRLSTTTTAFNSNMYSFITYTNLTDRDMYEQSLTDYVLGPTLHSYLSGGNLYDSSSLYTSGSAMRGGGSFKELPYIFSAFK